MSVGPDDVYIAEARFPSMSGTELITSIQKAAESAGLKKTGFFNTVLRRKYEILDHPHNSNEAMFYVDGMGIKCQSDWIDKNRTYTRISFSGYDDNLMAKLVNILGEQVSLRSVDDILFDP
jgi:hypothetical protein